MSPIWSMMKERQDIFNGFGAQESCDCLFIALIHPLMPTAFICKSDTIWIRFCSTLQEQHLFRVQRVLEPKVLKLTPLPYLSRKDPFYFNANAHKLYAAGIPCYRRSSIKLSVETLTLAHSMCLFNMDAVLEEDGVARGKFWYTGFTSSWQFCSSWRTFSSCSSWYWRGPFNDKFRL